MMTNDGNQRKKLERFLSHSRFSIDICQFSMTSLLSTPENKERSVSFRSIILIMIYAGTIILNLLAASIDDRFPVKRLQSQDNSTTITLMDSLEKDATVSRQNVVCWNLITTLTIFCCHLFSLHARSDGEGRNGLLIQHIINCPEQWCYCRLANDLINEHKSLVQHTGRNG
jgi:hypothetical protein